MKHCYTIFWIRATNNLVLQAVSKPAEQNVFFTFVKNNSLLIELLFHLLRVKTCNQRTPAELVNFAINIIQGSKWVAYYNYITKPSEVHVHHYSLFIIHALYCIRPKKKIVCLKARARVCEIWRFCQKLMREFFLFPFLFF